ncbi:diguanylate cyclase [Ideonella sp. YS5]|uniref:GGDEF domain-containing protein n=1 Tax=Ideonella sp. YS5 TaxID=3453714 RepID=UPI003EEC1F01
MNLRRSLLALALCCFACQAPASVPDRVLEVERELSDDPARALKQSEAQFPAAIDERARLDVLVRLVGAAGTLEQLDDLARHLPQAQRLADALGAQEAWCVIAAEAPAWRTREAGFETALAEADAARERARSLKLDWCLARLEHARGRLLVNEGRLADGASALLAALRHYESAPGEDLRAAAAYSELAWLAHREGGEASERLAIERGRSALSHLPTPAPRQLAATVHHNLAGALMAVGDYPAARTELEQALALAREIGDDIGSGYIGRLLARLELRERHPKAALDWLATAQPIFERAGLVEMQHVVATLRAEALLQQGRYQDAADVLAAAESLRKKVDGAQYDIDHWQLALKAHARLGHAQATADAADALVQALSRRENESRQRLLAETNARFQVERRDAENRLLRELQQGAVARQFWLVVSLSLLSLLLAGLLWHALQQRRVRQRLKTLAEVDELTQLPNRRAVVACLKQESDAARQAGSRLAVALCDIDHFKRVNDRFGHDVGDEALRCFARVGRQVIRRGDLLGRFGGEEFLLVLPGATPAAAQLLFDRLLGALRATQVTGLPEGETLSFSMGVAAWRADVSEEQLLREADEALYRAKARGRARMEAASEAGGRPVEAPGPASGEPGSDTGRERLAEVP